MKKIILIVLAVLVCSLSACSSGSDVSTITSKSDTSSVTTSQTETTLPPSTVKPSEKGTTLPPSTVKPADEETTLPPTTTKPPEETTKNTEWKSRYIDFLKNIDENSIKGYQLVYIDEDEIPELIAMGVSHTVPSYLCWVNNGSLCQASVSFSGFAYLEKQNRYICEEGFTGKGWDYVRRINGSEAEDLIKGELCTVQGQEYYIWNGVDYPNKEQYEAAKNSDFNKSAAKTVGNLKSYSEICSQIENY